MTLSLSERQYSPAVLLIVAAVLLLVGVLLIVLEDRKHAERIRTAAGVICILGAIALGIISEGRL